MRHLALFHLLLYVGTAAADPPVEVPANQPADVTVAVPKDASVVWRYYPPPAWKAKDLPPGRAIFAGKPGETITATAVVIDFGKKTVTDHEFAFRFGGKADPAPEPKPKPGPDPDPKPGPVTSFHVVMVYESGATLPPVKMGVLFSGEIRDYLDAATTPDAGTKGWRLRDKDANADNDTPFQKSLWAAIKPQVTTVPCYAVEVNGKVEIVPLPASVSEGLATLKRYNGGK